MQKKKTQNKQHEKEKLLGDIRWILNILPYKLNISLTRRCSVAENPSNKLMVFYPTVF